MSLKKKNRFKSFIRFVIYSFIIAFAVALAYGIHFISQVLADVPDIKQIELYSPEQITLRYTTETVIY